ncbi:MAG TPA: indole-3-glycerol phosphate synthase TrpC [Dongiaceae bacterium]|nr:indole-3-glycerol phosphate synthase TrpC [Dongiaceae bacterium]
MAFLNRILADTEKEIRAAKAHRSLDDLQRMIRDAPPVRSFREALAKNFALIGEIKRRSPSGGPMSADNFERAPSAYAQSPAVKAVSVLTNSTHFGMSIEELSRIRALVPKPVLRKDFLFDEYQLYEARAFGADAVLLMASVLARDKLERLFALAQHLGMDALFETHTREEIAAIPAQALIYGVNSRNFTASRKWWLARLLVRTGFGSSNPGSDPSVELRAFSLVQYLPSTAIKVAESGVGPDKVGEVARLGYHAVLVGTSLLKSPHGIEGTLQQFERAIVSIPSA